VNTNLFLLLRSIFSTLAKSLSLRNKKKIKWVSSQTRKEKKRKMVSTKTDKNKLSANRKVNYVSNNKLYDKLKKKRLK